MANATDTQPDAGTTPDASASNDADAQGSQAPTDEVSLLRSRYAGQVAKVDTLSKEKAALEAERNALKAQLDEAQKGVIDKDVALKTQLAAKDAEIAAKVREALLVKLEVKYPETFAALGEDAAALSEVKLSEIEARFKNAATITDEEPPTPRGVNPPKDSTTAAQPKEKSSKDLLATLKSMAVPW